MMGEKSRGYGSEDNSEKKLCKREHQLSWSGNYEFFWCKGVTVRTVSGSLQLGVKMARTIYAPELDFPKMES